VPGIESNAVKRKAIEDICGKPLKLIHREVHRQNEVLSIISTKDFGYFFVSCT
jgi:hypothetical protein